MTFKERFIIFLLSAMDFFSGLLPLRDTIILESFPDFADNTMAVYHQLIKDGYNKKYKIIWLLNGDEPYPELPDNVFCLKRKGSLLLKIQSRWTVSRAKFIIDCNQYVYKTNKKQIRVYLNHGLPMKNASEYNHKIGEVDLMPVPSEHWVKVCSYAHKVDTSCVKPLGFPRNDVLVPRPHDIKSVIWMPTYRVHKNGYESVDENIKNSFKNLLPFGLPYITDKEEFRQINELFKKNGAILLIRLHPSQDISDIDLNEMSNIKLCDNAFLKQKAISLYELLCYTDALVTDYSSIYYDYLMLDKPIALAAGDFDDYKKYDGLLVESYEEYKENYPAVFVESYEDLLAFFEDALCGKDTAAAQRRQAKDKYMAAQGSSAAKNVVDYIAKNYGL